MQLLIAASGLTDAGNWASIAAATFAFLLVAGGVARWAWRKWFAVDIDHALQFQDGTIFMEGMDTSMPMIKVGVKLRNGSAQPLRYEPTVFTVSIEPTASTVSIPGKSVPLDTAADIETLGPTEDGQWFAGAIGQPRDCFPVVVTVVYQIHYGDAHARKMRRALEGGFRTTVPLLEEYTTLSGHWDAYPPAKDRLLRRSERS